jgi:ADP-ribose pyrophosphatase YjhB (NUDIX family)
VNGPALPPRERRDSREYPERPVVGVGAIVVSGGRVLIVKRRFEPLAGRWSLPGGTLEVGETLEAGVAREIFEETGLRIDVGPVVEVFDRILLDQERRVRYHFVLVDYLCWPQGGDLAAGSDVEDARFVSPDDLPSFDLTEKAQAVIDRALELDRKAPGTVRS